MSDYTKFSLEKLDEWVHDTLHNEELMPSDIYEQILQTVQENLEYHSKYVTRCQELIRLMSSKKSNSSPSERMQKVATINYKEATELGWTMTDDGFWMPPQKENDKVNRWILPVNEENGEQFINLPNDLLEKVNWSQGDTLEWRPSGADSEFILQKVSQ